MQKPARATEILHRLRAPVFELAIGEIGTGFLPLSDLRKLPLTRLRISRSFVQGPPGDADDQAISCTTMSPGQKLRLKVIAEGVEAREQAEFLRDAGCSADQRLLFSRPQPADTITATPERLAPQAPA